VFAFPTQVRSACIGTEVDRSVDVANPEAVFNERLAVDDELAGRVKAATRDGRWHVGELPRGWFRHAGGHGWALVGYAELKIDPLLGHGITDAFMSASLVADAIHQGLADGNLDAALTRYDDVVWETLGPMYEASRDAASDFDKNADELFAAITPAQMISAANAEMVEAGGPSL
jgi:flavin-dependent dehydrogenase